ncbi:MAG: hypothetical protein KatS3mg038_2954 [Candidatus Kapaibacterium sp.]|nr:MAG: hypothetical protein KatS3mg038_2954 [Candidatus Kapabacteria bacterium]
MMRTWQEYAIPHDGLMGIYVGLHNFSGPTWPDIGPYAVSATVVGARSCYVDW